MDVVTAAYCIIMYILVCTLNITQNNQSLLE